jgi:hypothetical protein
MTYYAALAEALRTRRCTEAQVRNALMDVHETTARSGGTPEDEFGPARQYAATFTGTRGHPPGQVIRWLILPAAIIAVFLLRIYALPDIEFIPWGALLGAGVFIVIWALSQILASLINPRIPNNLKFLSGTEGSCMPGRQDGGPRGGIRIRTRDSVQLLPRR